MTDSERPGLLGRFSNLMRGLFSGWIRRRENQSPEAVYEQAIEGRVQHYRDLKQAVAGILFMRTKLEAEINERRAEIARLHDDIRRGLRRGRDEIALTLIAKKQALFEDLERSERELEEVRSAADEAKHNLARFREEIRSLVREKGRMLATLANAKARRRLQQALDGISVEADMAALESVRDHIGQLATEGQIDRELGDDGMRQRLRNFRDEARHDAARAELEQLKSELSNSVIPATAREVEPAAAAAG